VSSRASRRNTEYFLQEKAAEVTKQKEEKREKPEEKRKCVKEEHLSTSMFSYEVHAKNKLRNL
jgi:hypothetical protein